MANPASAKVKPRRVIYSVKNGTTNVPNLFRKTPTNKIQTGRGNDRSVARSDSFATTPVPGFEIAGIGLSASFGFIFLKIKNPADHSVGRVGKIDGSFNFRPPAAAQCA